jgi:hypothetical protein
MVLPEPAGQDTPVTVFVKGEIDARVPLWRRRGSVGLAS